ncbi:MAG: flavin reductase family protein [Planctomycetes bacterium]|nr:flavin reductase family protein [Planctomycetota bacterium]
MAKVKIHSKATSLCRCRPCMIITTLHESGGVNAGTFGAYTNVGPKEIAIAIGMPSHTYQNIKRTGEFVINIPNQDQAHALEVCGESIPPDKSELDEAGLTTAPADRVKAPLIAEFPANIECEFWKETDIGYHSLIIGKVLCGHLEEDLLDKDGSIDVIKAKVPFCIRYPEPLYAVLGDPQVAKK